MPKRRVNVDRYTWRTPIEGAPGTFDTHVASRGDVIDVPASEVDRVAGALIATGDTPGGPVTTPLAAGGTPLADAVGPGVQGPVPPTDAPASGPTDERAAAPSTPDLKTVLTDAQLATLSVPLVQAYVVEHPDELDRVLDLEQNRDGGPRKGVTDLAR